MSSISVPTTAPRRRGGLAATLREHPEYVLIPALFVFVVGLWEAIVKFGEIPIYIIPAPSDVWTALVNGIGSGLYITNGAYTLAQALLGFLCAAVAGVVIGSLNGNWRFAS